MAVVLLTSNMPTAFADAPIRVGILHSLSGTMAVSEVTLKDVMLMLIDQQNEDGGLLGRKLEPVVLDPASNWSLYAEKARQLIEREKVAVIFGCWTSSSRKSVLPVVENLNRLLFYPVQYEGQEQSPNIFYLGAAPNQQAIPAVEFLLKQRGIERWILVGTDYVYPRTINSVLVAHLMNRGVEKSEIMLSYTPFGHTGWQRIVEEIKGFASQGRKTAVISTINGDANLAFYRELSLQGIEADDIPVLAFSVGEEELTNMEIGPLEGHLAAWNYFMSVDSAENDAFINDWRKFTGDATRVTNDPMEAYVIGFEMWVRAVEQAGTIATDEVREALIGMRVSNLSGGIAEMLPNHHISRPAYVGQIRADGQYDIIWQSAGSIKGAPWSPYLKRARDGAVQ